MPNINVPVDPQGANTPKGKALTTIVYSSNAPFDARITSRPRTTFDRVTGSNKLYRGYITTAKTPAPNKHVYTLNFLYNPSVVGVNHSVDTSANYMLPYFARKDDTAQNPLLPVNANVSFDLLFDRTYELFDSSKLGTYVNTAGVLADVTVLYSMLGIINSVNVVQPGTTGLKIGGGGAGTTPVDAANSDVGSSNGDENGAQTPSIMLYTPVWVYFGAPTATSTDKDKLQGRLSYYGVISSISITYTHFSQTMVPFRCAISVSMTLLPQSGVGSGATTAAGAAAGTKPKASTTKPAPVTKPPSSTITPGAPGSPGSG